MGPAVASESRHPSPAGQAALGNPVVTNTDKRVSFDRCRVVFPSLTMRLYPLGLAISIWGWRLIRRSGGHGLKVHEPKEGLMEGLNDA